MHERNSPEQIGQVAASIREFGFTNPVLIDGAHGIIAGHARVLAAQKARAGRCARHGSEAQRRAYVLADNKLALNAGWDLDLLKIGSASLRPLVFLADNCGPAQAFNVLDGRQAFQPIDDAPVAYAFSAGRRACHRTRGGVRDLKRMFADVRVRPPRQSLQAHY